MTHRFRSTYVPVDGVPGNDKLTSESPTIHPELPFHFPQPRFWLVSEQVPTIRELSWLTLTFYRKRCMLT